MRQILASNYFSVSKDRLAGEQYVEKKMLLKIKIINDPFFFFKMELYAWRIGNWEQEIEDDKRECVREKPDSWQHSGSVQDPPKLCKAPSYARSFPKKRKNSMMIHFRRLTTPELHPSPELHLPPSSVPSHSQAGTAAIWNSRFGCAGNWKRICRHQAI